MAVNAKCIAWMMDISNCGAELNANLTHSNQDKGGPTKRSKKQNKAIYKENLTGKLTTKRRRANFQKRRRSFVSGFLWADPVT